MYIEKLKPYQTFESIDDLNEAVSRFLSVHGYELPPATKRVLETISRHSCKVIGASWLKRETIAELTGYGLTSVKNAIRILKSLGILKVIPTTREKTGGDGANIYVLQDVIPADCPPKIALRGDADEPRGIRDQEPFFEDKTNSFKALKKDDFKRYINRAGQLINLHTLTPKNLYQLTFAETAEEKGLSDEHIQKTLAELGDMSFNHQVMEATLDRVLTVYDRGGIGAFARYFVKSLETAMEDFPNILQRRRIREAEEERKRALAQTFPFYNWLEG